MLTNQTRLPSCHLQVDTEYDMTMETGDLLEYFTARIEHSQILYPRRLCQCIILQMRPLNREGGNWTQLMLLLSTQSAKGPIAQEGRLALPAIRNSSGAARA